MPYGTNLSSISVYATIYLHLFHVSERNIMFNQNGTHKTNMCKFSLACNSLLLFSLFSFFLSLWHCQSIFQCFAIMQMCGTCNFLVIGACVFVFCMQPFKLSAAFRFYFIHSTRIWIRKKMLSASGDFHARIWTRNSVENLMKFSTRKFIFVYLIKCCFQNALSIHI